MVEGTTFKHYDDIREVLVMTVDYAKHCGGIMDSHMRTRVPLRASSITKHIFSIMNQISDAICVNFGSLDRAMADKRTFAANGYGGVVMSMDFRHIKVNNTMMYMLLGVNCDGRLRHLELLDVNSEGDAMIKSQWFQRLTNREKSFPKSFAIAVGKNETVMVPALFLIDSQLTAAMQGCTD